MEQTILIYRYNNKNINGRISTNESSESFRYNYRIILIYYLKNSIEVLNN